MPDDRPMPSSHAPSDHRVTALEEHAAFSERTIEHLSTEIAELNRRCRVLSDRLALLEQRLGSLLDDDDEQTG